MKKADFDALKARVREVKEKSTDMDILIAAIMKLPYGQFKKAVSDEVMAVLKKYGYTE